MSDPFEEQGIKFVGKHMVHKVSEDNDEIRFVLMTAWCEELCWDKKKHGWTDNWNKVGSHYRNMIKGEFGF